MSEPKWKQHWPEFSEALIKRLNNGHQTYGEVSFERPIEEILAEMEEEAADICGWGLIAWARLRELRKKLVAIENGNSTS